MNKIISNMKISFPMIAKNFHRKHSSKSNSDVVFKNQNHFGVIVLNRPKQLNSLVISIIEPMFDQLEKWEKDSNIKAVVIKSSSEEVFSAGGDMKKARMWSLNGKQNTSTPLRFFLTIVSKNVKIMVIF